MLKAQVISSHLPLAVDEGVPSGISTHMLREVIEKLVAFVYLDSSPKPLSAEEHRSAYGSDGDYWFMPNPESKIDS